MVDLEVVVLVATEHEERRRVAVRHVLRVRDRHAVRVLERAVARVGDLRDGADDQMVVAAAHVDDRDARGVVREHGVGTAEGVDLEPLDRLEGDRHVRHHGRLDEADAERTAAGGVERDVVRLIRSEHGEVVDTRGSARVGDLDATVVVERDRDQVVLRVRLEVAPVTVTRRVVAAVVEDRLALPRRDCARSATDVDRVVAVVHDHRVVAVAAGQDGDLEDAVDRLDGRAGGIVVAVPEATPDIRVVGVHHRRELVFAEHVAGGLRERDARVVVGRDEARDERVAVERDVEVERLDEGVGVAGRGAGAGGARVDERVAPGAAGDGVAAEATVEDVVERRADQPVVAGAADEGELDQVGRVRAERGGGRRGTERRRVEGVVAALAVDDERVVLAAHRVLDGDELALGVNDLDALLGVVAADRERVVGREAVDDDPVACPVVRDVQDRLLDLEAGIVRIVDELHLAGVGDDPARVDGDALNARADERLDGGGVCAGAEVDHDLLDPNRPDSPVLALDLNVVARSASDVDRVVTARRSDHEVVGVGDDPRRRRDVIAVDQREGRGRRQRQLDQVVAGAAADVVVAAVRYELVVAGAAAHGVVAGAADHRVVAVATVHRRADAAQVLQVVVAVAAVEDQRPGRRLADLQVVVAAAAVEARRPGAAVDERVVARSTVQVRVGEDAFLDDDRVVA